MVSILVVDWFVVDCLVVDWFVVDWHLVDWLMVYFMVNFLMSWGCNDWSRVVVVMVLGDDWFDVVLFSVLVLRVMISFVVRRWSRVGVDWLSVRMLVYINNWVVVSFVLVVRVISWVGVDSLVVMMNFLMMNWLNLMGLIAFQIVRDSLVGHTNIISSGVMLMVIVMVPVVVVIMVVMSVLEFNSTVLIIMVVGTVFDFMISFVVNELVFHGMMFSLTSFNMGLNLVNASLLKWSMV